MAEAFASGAPATPGEMVARLVHDLHGPLTVIRGLCATLARDEARPERRRAIDLIDGETLRLAAGLEDVARASVGASASAVGRLDLAALVTGVAERFAELGGDRGATLTTRGLHRSAWVEGDAQMLARLVENLLRNALRHCATAGVVVLALTIRGGRAVLQVRDDGDGVPVVDRERIFIPGERGGAARGDGRGLGLAIAREIAEAHRGRLSLDPVGTGASFRLSLPLGAPDHGPRAA